MVAGRLTSTWHVVAVVAVGIMSALAVLVASTIVAFGLFISCGGDGGSPYAARDSPYGTLCTTGLIDVWAIVIWVAPTVLILGGMTVAVVRRHIPPVAIGIGGAGMLLAATIVIASATPDRCSAEQVANGGDCEIY